MKLARLRRVLPGPLDLMGVVAAVIYGLPSFWYPFAGDQPIHWYLGRGILHGHMPYATGVSTKPPAAFLVHSVAIALFGEGQWGIRILDMGFVIGCAVLIATFRVRLSRDAALLPRRDGEIGVAALLVSGIYFTFFDWAATAHPELWQAFFMLWALHVVARAPGGVVSWRRALAAGAIACVAVMFKHVAAFTGVIAGLAATLMTWRHAGLRRALVAAGAYTGGVALVLVLTVLPFVLTGTFDALWEVMVEFILKYAGQAPGADGDVVPFLRLESGGPAVIVAFAGLCAGLAVASRGRGRHREEAWIVLGGTLAAVGSVLAQLRAAASHVFDYYWIVCVPFFALSIAWGLRQAMPRRAWPAPLVAVALVAGFFQVAPPWPAARPEHDYPREWESLLAYLDGGAREDHYVHYGLANRIDRYDTQERVGLFVRERAQPGDTMCVEGFATAIYTVAGLRCPSRHFAEITAYEGLDGWMEEHRRVLEETPPTFLVTFPDRRDRVRELEEMGYTRNRVEGAPLFVVMERRADP